MKAEDMPLGTIIEFGGQGSRSYAIYELISRNVTTLIFKKLYESNLKDDHRQKWFVNYDNLNHFIRQNEVKLHSDHITQYKQKKALDKEVEDLLK